MIPGKPLRPNYCLAIKPINVKESDHAELFGITTDKHREFMSECKLQTACS